MYVRIVADTSSVEDLENLRALDVRADGATPTQVAAALASARLGTLDGDHAWLSIAALKSAGSGRGAEWDRDFDAMISYASSRGWTSDEGTVRAHLA